MAIYVPHSNVESNESFGQAINKLLKEYINPELKRRKLKNFQHAGIEIFKNGKHKVYLDSETNFIFTIERKNINPSTKVLKKVDLKEIKEINWDDSSLKHNSAKIVLIRFNDNWWIYQADFSNHETLEERFKVTRTLTARGRGKLPLAMKRNEKDVYKKEWQDSLEAELPSMWKRHITISQRYSGVISYDGNYFDLFIHAQELYELGYYYSSIVICRIAAEQALIGVLKKKGKHFHTTRDKNKEHIKSIRELIKTCRDSSLFKKQYLINKTAEKKLYQIAEIADDNVHPKQTIEELDKYKNDALQCMDNLQYVIKNHLNIIKDTGVVSGYRYAGQAKRLK